MPDSLLWNPQMRKAYKAAIGLGLGGLALGSSSRAYTALRDNSLAIGDIQDNLRLLADDDPYLANAGGAVILPKKKDKKTTDKRVPLELDSKFANQKLAGGGLMDWAKGWYDSTSKNLDELTSPLTTICRGSTNPSSDGRESVWNIPATYAMGLPALFAGTSIGHDLVDKRLKRVADDKVKAERAKAKREFEAALVYEQESSRNARRKWAEEQCDLVNAVDEFYSACTKYSHYEKQATDPDPAANWSLIKILLALTATGSTMAGYGMFQNAYNQTKKQIEQSEKEKLLGLNSDYAGVYGDLTARHIDDSNSAVKRGPAPKITDRLVKFNDEPEEKSTGLMDYVPFSKIAAGAAMPLIGAGLGSLAGGVAGYYSDSDPKKRKRNALWSALGGGLGGGLGGYLLDTPAEAAGLKVPRGSGSALKSTADAFDKTTGNSVAELSPTVMEGMSNEEAVSKITAMFNADKKQRQDDTAENIRARNDGLRSMGIWFGARPTETKLYELGKSVKPQRFNPNIVTRKTPSVPYGLASQTAVRKVEEKAIIDAAKKTILQTARAGGSAALRKGVGYIAGAPASAALIGGDIAGMLASHAANNSMDRDTWNYLVKNYKPHGTWASNQKGLGDWLSLAATPFTKDYWTGITDRMNKVVENMNFEGIDAAGNKDDLFNFIKFKDAWEKHHGVSMVTGEPLKK
jgi:hypothetical protein